MRPIDDSPIISFYVNLLRYLRLIVHKLHVKPVSQIHRFHLRLGYDALAACFLVISVGGLRRQCCRSFFFHAAGAPFEAPASFNFSLKFSECRWRAIKKKASRSSRSVVVRRRNRHRSAIFHRKYDFSSATWDQLLVCARKASEGE
jgi:hypothetical protein